MIKVYDYTGWKKEKGRKKKVRGKVAARNREEAVYLLTRIEGIEDPEVRLSLNLLEQLKPVSPFFYALFFETLGLIMEAGGTPQEAAELLLEENLGTKFEWFVKKFAYGLSEGLPLHEALAQTGYLPKEVVNIVKAGVESGRATEVFLELKKYFEGIAKIRKATVGALLYPFVVIAFLLAFSFYAPILVKNLQGLYENLGGELPLYSRVVFKILLNLRTITAVGLAVGGLGLWAVYSLYQSSKDFKRAVDAFFLKLPVVGKFLIKTSIYKSFLAFKVLYSAGIPVDRILKMIRDSQSNEIIKEEWDKSYRIVAGEEKGDTSLTKALEVNRFVPGVAKVQIKAGIRSGKLKETLSKLVEYAATDFNAYINFIGNFAARVVLVVIGLIVGLVVLAVYYPVFSAGELIAR